MPVSSKLSISQITDYLYISAYPDGGDVEMLVDFDVRLILSMHWWRPSKKLGQAPLHLLWLPTIDRPFAPIPMKTLNRGVRAALPVIRDGYAVLSHCKAGIHRSVAMAACVLIGSGYIADDAMQLIKEKRSVADPDVGYINKRIRMFESQWSGSNY